MRLQMRKQALEGRGINTPARTISRRSLVQFPDVPPPVNSHRIWISPESPVIELGCLKRLTFLCLMYRVVIVLIIVAITYYGRYLGVPLVWLL